MIKKILSYFSGTEPATIIQVIKGKVDFIGKDEKFMETGNKFTYYAKDFSGRYWSMSHKDRSFKYALIGSDFVEKNIFYQRFAVGDYISVPKKGETFSLNGNWERCEAPVEGSKKD